jgi:hypothetical protein
MTVSTIAADVAAAGDHGPTIAGRLRFKLELALLMLACGRTGEAQVAFLAAFDLLDQLDPPAA